MNNSQLELLKRIDDAGYFDYSKLNSEEKEILSYLSKCKFIRTKANPDAGRRIYYVITELGKDQLHKSKQNDFRFWLPIIISNTISFIALFISIIALSKQ